MATFLRPSFNVVDPGDCPSVGTGAVTLVPSLSSNGESRCLCPSPSGCSGDRRGAGVAPCCYTTSDTVTSRDRLIVAFPPAWKNGTQNTPLYADGGGTRPRRGAFPGV